MRKMAQSVKHRYTGEMITFLQSAADTQGAYLLIEVALPALGSGPPLHKHDRFEEEFEVRKGKLTVNVGGDERVLEVGERLSVPRQVAHTFRNGHDEQLVFRVRLTPPQQFEESVRIHYGLMDDGLTNAQGMPTSIWDAALIMMLQNTWIADKPQWVQRVLFGTLVRVGSWTGRYRRLEKYVGKKVRVHV